MRWILATLLVLAQVPGVGRAENLRQAWGVALAVNGRLHAQQEESLAAGHNVAAAKAARGPRVTNITINTLITPQPSFATVAPSPAGPNSGGFGGTTQGSGNNNNNSATGGIGLGSFGFFGQGQVDVPVSNTSVVQPIYAGGRLRNNVNAANADLSAQQAEECREAMDLKLVVAEAYVSVLRAMRGQAVADSNVTRLESFVADTRNRVEEGLATRNDQLSAELSLANARQSRIHAQRLVSSAWATYNRYLCRPLTTIVPLEELMVAPATGDLGDLTTQALRSHPALAGAGESEIRSLTQHALQARPELASLTEQARSLGYQAEAARSGTRPQVTANVGHTLLGFSGLNHQNYLTSALFVNWTLGDSGATRRRVESLRHQESAAISRRADAAEAIALEIRNRWLELAEARRQIPVAREAIDQAEENVRVVLDRYRQGLSTYTQVLDAESLRVQSLTNFYEAAYDGVLATLRLRRAAGDL